MKLKLLILFLGWILIFSSCKNERIPLGAIPIVYRGHLYIKGEADNNIGNYVFDTGVLNLCFDSTYYEENKFNYVNTFTADLIGVGTTTKTVIVVADQVEFKFEENLYKTSNVPIIQLKSILGDIADGILGMEYFYNTILEINYAKEYIKIYKSIDSVNIEGWSKIKLTKIDDRMYIPLEVSINENTNITGHYLLDFGSGGAVSFTSLTAEQYNLSEQIQNKISYSTKHGGAGGASSHFDFIAKTVKIGDYEFENVRSNFSTDNSGAMAAEDYLGILGNRIFERFNIYIDFTKNDLYLKPNENYNNLFEIPRLGFSYIDRVQTLNAWIVTGLYASSNTEEAGLEIDDKIVSVNGLNVSDISYERRKVFFDDIDRVNLGINRKGSLMKISFIVEPILKEPSNI